MKAKEIINNLKLVLKEQGTMINTSSDHHLMFMLDEARAKFAAQKMDAKVNVVQMAQFVDVVPIPVDTKASIMVQGATVHQNSTAPILEIVQESTEVIKFGSVKVLKLIIPDPIAYMNGGGVFTVGPTDGSSSFSQISYSQLRLATHRLFTGSVPKWFFFENAIYVINATTEAYQKIRIRGIFDRPFHIEIFQGRYKYLHPFDWEYPLSMKDLPTIYQIAIANDLGWGDAAAAAINKEQLKQKKDTQLVDALKGLNTQNAEV